MKTDATGNSIDQRFWQLKACATEAEQNELLEQIRLQDPSLAQALKAMLDSEGKLGSFMALSDEPSVLLGDLVEPPGAGWGEESGENPSSIEESAMAATLDSHPADESQPTRKQSQLRTGSTQVPEQIGPYKLLEPIGEGGMGVVFLAQQSKPVRRKVAVKVIKPGLDSRQVIARFEAERQALAMMDHRHIAKVLDAGTTDAGLPFFVMELVRGIPMNAYCDRSKMPTEQRLLLFKDVCDAIQHSHNKGVIHRDIKPSNVLVTEQDGKAVVKVIDFGIAKALTDNLTDKTLFTGMFQMLGTPLYMSPEQASLSGVDVDTRSDVYSLGVMLYELLSGSLPVDRDEARGLSFDELRKRICDTEPPKPSKRLSTLKDERETVAERRGVDVSRIHQLVTSELDWIVMRSIEKDRKRRYQSAREFAEDIQRYLDGDVVEACPPSTFYVVRKKYRKHRVSVVFALSICILMLVAVVGTSVQAVRATQAEELAESRLQALQIAKDEIEISLQNAEKQRDKATRSYEQARAAVKKIVQRAAAKGISSSPEMAEVRNKLLTDAVGFYTKLCELNPTDSRNFAERASLNQSREKFEFVRPDLEHAIALQPDNAEYHHLLGNFLHNCLDVAFRAEDPGVALTHVKKAIELGPVTPHYLANLAQIYDFRLEDSVMAERYYREAANAAGDKRPQLKLEYLVMADRAAGNHKDVIKHANAVDPASGLAQFIYHRIAESHMALGEFQEALEMETKALESARRHKTDKANHFAIYLLSGRGNAHKRLGEYEEALHDYEAVIELTPYRSYTYKSKATVLYLLGRNEDIIDTLRKSLELNPEDFSAYFSIHPEYLLRKPDEEFAKQYLKFMTEGVAEARKSGKPDDVAALLYYRCRVFLVVNDPASANADRVELGTLMESSVETEITAERIGELDQLITEQKNKSPEP